MPSHSQRLSAAAEAAAAAHVQTEMRNLVALTKQLGSSAAPFDDPHLFVPCVVH
jgi:hypothetical protein